MSDHGERIDKTTIRFQRLLPGPIDRVWSFLVESEKRGRWLAQGDTELRVGGKISLHFYHPRLSSLPDVAPPEKYKDLPEEITFHGVVTQCDHPRLLSHTWIGDNENSEVCYELETQGDRVLLTLTHNRLGSDEQVVGTCGGWHTHLEILAAVLADQTPQPFWTRFNALEAEYAERLRS